MYILKERSLQPELSVIIPLDKSDRGPLLIECFGRSALRRILASMGESEHSSKGLQTLVPVQGTVQTGPHIALGVDSLTTLMFHHPVYQVRNSLCCLRDANAPTAALPTTYTRPCSQQKSAWWYQAIPLQPALHHDRVVLCSIKAGVVTCSNVPC